MAKLRSEFGDDDARDFVLRTEATNYLNKVGKPARMWLKNVNDMTCLKTWVRELKLEILENFNVLKRDELLRAVELCPKILDLTGPKLKDSFDCFVKRRKVFGPKLSDFRQAVRVAPQLLGTQAAVVDRADEMIRDVCCQ